ncbi:hypothetical protein V8E36_002243 [Tilletia maclaganii]
MTASTSTATDSMQGRVVWQPSAAAVEQAAITRFRHHIEATHVLSLPDYHALWQWSCAHPDQHWDAIFKHLDIIHSAPYSQIIHPSRAAQIYPPPTWFTGARLNIAQNYLERHLHHPDAHSHPAIIECSESASSSTSSTPYIIHQTLTWPQLRTQVSKLARALRNRDIHPHDRIAVYGANCAMTTIVFLAAASIGAIFVSAAADFAEAGTLERLRLVRPKILFGVNAVRYNGKVLDHVGKLRGVVNGLKQQHPSTHAPDDEPEQALELTVLHDLVPSHSPEGSTAATQSEGWISWDDLLQEGIGTDIDHSSSTSIEYEQLDFNHPLWILFSSGTTGAPKAITHRAGGMLLQLAKEHLIHGGLKREDVFFQYTTPGWMMMNFAWGALIAGCPIVLYDGSPLKPASVLWELADALKITVFGTSASYLSALQKSGYRPRDHFPSLPIRQILSTGSPLRADLYPWILDAVGPDILIGSITGGTDICSLFAGHNEALPVRAGELQARNLGMDVDVFDDQGQSVGMGKEGDLVCKTPFPAQPLGFWRQPDSRYRDSYYAQFPNVWYHGDFCMLSEHQGLVMLGRSDGILNPGGIRFGSSEIYEILENGGAGRREDTGSSLGSPQPEGTAFLDSIEDSLVVALKTPQGDDEVVVLFLVTRPHRLEPAAFETLSAQVKTLIRARRSARHVPKFVQQVSGVPKTLNGKRVEVPVKKLLNGAPLASINQATLLNPEVLGEYVEAGELLRARLSSGS